MLSISKRKINIVDYSSSYVESYKKESERILKKISSIVEKIEHVGGTSMPGVKGKPIIDIVIMLKHGIDLDDSVRYFESLNYHFNPQLVDYRPNRRIFWLGSAEVHLYHLHVVSNGCVDWGNLIKFRDKIRSSKTLQKRYQQLKLKLVEVDSHDVVKYVKGKEDFFWEVVNE